jgi:hypothetical protein
MKHLLLAAVVVGAFGSITTVPASAAVVVVETAPPPPRAERMPPPRRGYVWSPGHWEWRRGHHVWVGGTWLRERHGYAYHAPAWVQRDGRTATTRGRTIRTAAEFPSSGTKQAPSPATRRALFIRRRANKKPPAHCCDRRQIQASTWRRQRIGRRITADGTIPILGRRHVSQVPIRVLDGAPRCRRSRTIKAEQAERPKQWR